MTVRDIALNTDGDLDVTLGDLVLVEDVDAIAQSLRIRMQFFRGEWFLDITAGIPLFEYAMVKIPNPNVLQSIFRAAILETPGVSSVEDLTLDYDRANRTLNVSYRVVSDTGELIAGTAIV